MHLLEVSRPPPSSLPCLRVDDANFHMLAIGDTWMKIPSVYSHKVLRRTKEFWSSGISEVNVDRIKTPPYVSNAPQVYHEQLRSRRSSSPSGDVDVALVICSDGLVDLYEDQDFEEEYILKRWAAKIGEKIAPVSASRTRLNLAAHLLRDAIGGDDLARASANLTVEMEERWMDDTTILVHRFL